MSVVRVARWLLAIAVFATPVTAAADGYTTVRELVRTGWGETNPFCEVPDAFVPIAIDAHRISEPEFATLYTTITGLDLDPRDAHRVVRALRNRQDRTRTTFVPTTSAVSATFIMQAATLGAATEMLVELGKILIDAANGTLDPPLCYTVTKRLYAAGVYGAIEGAAFAVYQGSAFRTKHVSELADDAIAELLDWKTGLAVDLLWPDFVRQMGEMFASDYVGKGVCGIWLYIYWAFHDRAEVEELAQEIVDGIEGNLTNFAMRASGTGETVRGGTVRLVDSTNVTRAIYRSDETATASGDFAATLAGTYNINVVAANANASAVISSTTASLAAPGNTTFSVAFSCQRVLDLLGGTGGDFTIYPVITAPNGTIWHPDNKPQIRRTSIRLVNRNAANPPVLSFIAQSSGSTLVLDVLYSDIDGNAPASFTVRINGNTVGATPYETSTTRGYERRYSVSATLPAGNHTVRIDASDGLNTVAKSETVRHSPNPPRLTLSASPSSVTAGSTTNLAATLVDDVGPLPNETIRFLTTGSGAFGGGIANSVRSVTNTSGVAAKSFRPSSSGTHTLTAFWGPSTYGTTSLSVASGAAGLETEWTFSRQTSTATQATYYVTARITNNGVPVTYLDGADVTIQVNHGTASKSQDSPSSNGEVQFEYTLTAAEAASGDEVFTLHVDIYDATLIHAVNLQVGAAATFSPVRETNLDASTSSDQWSQAVAFSRDGRYIARVTDPTISIYRWEDLSVVRTHTDSNNRGTGIVFSPDGSKVAYGDHRGGVTIIDIATGSTTRRVITANSADIINLDWYSADRIALGTMGVSSANYGARVIIVDAALNVVSTLLFPGLPLGYDVARITCHAGKQLCAVSSSLSQWFVMRTSGSVFSGPFTHPDDDEVTALAFNVAGDRLFVGGFENNGSHYALLYSVGSSSLSLLGSPSTVNNDVFSAAFITEAGQELLVLGGSNALEVYRTYLGIPERSSTGLGYPDRLSHTLAFSSTGILAEMNQRRQLYYNFSGDYDGPSIGIPRIEVPYRQTTATLAAHCDDPSGVVLVEWSRDGGSYATVTVPPSGDFDLTLASLPVGDTTVSVRAKDAKWNMSTATTVVTRLDDTVAPIVSDVSLSPGTATRTTSIRVECTIRDEDSTVAAAETVVLRGGTEVKRVAMTPTGDRYGVTFSLSDVAAPAGLYSVDIITTDSSPHTNTRTVRGAAAFQVLEPVDPPASVTATATTTTSITITWTVGNGAATYELHKHSGAGYQLIATTPGTSAVDTAVTADRAYLYRVRSRAADGRTSPDSTADLATTLVFTEPVITARSTIVRSAHWTELRRAIDAVRALAALAPATYSSGISAGTPIGAGHLTEMRAAVVAARSALGLATPPFTDAGVTARTTAVKAVHLTQLRDAVR